MWHMPKKRPSGNALKRVHRTLCCTRAFPKSFADHSKARVALSAFESRVDALSCSEQARLWDAGIAGTPIHYGFSFEVARWLARKAPGAVSIDWEAIDDTLALDELLTHLLQPSEDEYFDGGYVSSREWIDTVRAACSGTDFDWLMAQLNDRQLRLKWSQLYDAADLPLTWNLGNSRFSTSKNVLPLRHIRTREGGMRDRPRAAKREIQRPLESIEKLSSREGAKLIDVAMASLAVRHRETWHFNYANPREVYLADVGEGVAVAVFGLLPEFRFPLECTMGYLILSNGVPIGYGGSSIVFRQVNTGINIFDEFRGSEASYLWVQVMRVYHALFGCTRFIANAYQFGGDNDEALKSGAFWFYYRLGYRPVLTAVRKLAQREAARIRRNRTYRSDKKTLRRLGRCDMHLTLPGTRARDLVEERRIETSSMLATERLGASGGITRNAAAKKVAAGVARDLGIRSFERWSVSERRAFRNIAPLLAAANPGNWTKEEKRSMREISRAKGADGERRYAQQLLQHEKFLNSLSKACRRAECL